ncbi:uncharacterized protein LOC130140816 [Syzygium oleosum]|uniref:uncharacterized protein LOC130140816 n=1 Tax=Syzygium oleosum TaxID=219896 RepID=UPI0024B9F4AD|nr:uncharacterized protein LOC130140816 [Syzygium oleosum]
MVIVMPCHPIRGETKSHALPQTGLRQIMEKEEELSKPELKPLRSLQILFYLSMQSRIQHLFFPVADSNEVKADRKKEAESKSSRSTEQSFGQNDADEGVKKQDGFRSSNKEGVTKVASQGSPTGQQDGIGRSSANGKVKEFIIIFNQKAALKPKVDVRPQVRKSWKTTSWNHHVHHKFGILVDF